MAAFSKESSSVKAQRFFILGFYI